MDSAVLDLDHENDFELMQVIAEYLVKHQGFETLHKVFAMAELLQKD